MPYDLAHGRMPTQAIVAADGQHTRLDLGCGHKKQDGWIGVDFVPLRGVDVCCDLKKLPWPFRDNVATEVRLDNVIEHLPDTVAVFNELHRVCAPSATVTVIWPHCRSRGAYGDPTHVHFFNEYMIDYFLAPGLSTRRENRFAYYTQCHWRLLSRRLITYPIFNRVPQRILSFWGRHLIGDVIHAVQVEISPIK